MTTHVTQSTDAKKWAREFMRMIEDHEIDPDEALMLTWFSNAIEVGRDAGYTAGMRDAKEYMAEAIDREMP